MPCHIHRHIHKHTKTLFFARTIIRRDDLVEQTVKKKIFLLFVQRFNGYLNCTNIIITLKWNLPHSVQVQVLGTNSAKVLKLSAKVRI